MEGMAFLIYYLLGYPHKYHHKIRTLDLHCAQTEALTAQHPALTEILQTKTDYCL